MQNVAGPLQESDARPIFSLILWKNILSVTYAVSEKIFVTISKAEIVTLNHHQCATGRITSRGVKWRAIVLIGIHRTQRYGVRDPRDELMHENESSFLSR